MSRPKVATGLLCPAQSVTANMFHAIATKRSTLPSRESVASIAATAVANKRGQLR